MQRFYHEVANAHAHGAAHFLGALARPAEGQPLQVKQYRRVDGVLDLPPNAVVKTVTARVLEGATVRTSQTMAIE